MGVETYDCDGCGDNGVHESFIYACDEGHHFCDDCVEKLKLNINDDGEYEITNCPECKEEDDKENEFQLLNKMLDKLLEMYNKRRKNKLTISDLKEIILKK
jgi:hypothetical protein